MLGTRVKWEQKESTHDKIELESTNAVNSDLSMECIISTVTHPQKTEGVKFDPLSRHEGVRADPLSLCEGVRLLTPST